MGSIKYSEAVIDGDDAAGLSGAAMAGASLVTVNPSHGHHAKDLRMSCPNAGFDGSRAVGEGHRAADTNPPVRVVPGDLPVTVSASAISGAVFQNRIAEPVTGQERELNIKPTLTEGAAAKFFCLLHAVLGGVAV